MKLKENVINLLKMARLLKIKAYDIFSWILLVDLKFVVNNGSLNNWQSIFFVISSYTLTWL